MNKPRKSTLFNISLAIISVLSVLLIAEIIMRFAWQMSGWVKRPVYRRSFDPYLRYELVPSMTYSNLSINSDGFRGREYSIKKPAGIFRILMLGDSETLSILLPESAALASQLEVMLNRGLAQPRYEVLNFGVEGYNTLQELEQFKTKGMKYSPDLVILNYCLNDPEPGEYYFNKTFFMRHSALVRYFSVRIKKALIKRERKRLGIATEVQHFAYLYQPKYFKGVKEAILEMADLADSLGAKLAVAVFPTSSLEVKNFRESYPYEFQHKLVKGIDGNKVVFIDLIDEFNRLGLGPQDVSINYKENESHKNAAALGVAAEYICKTLRDRRLIR